MSHGNVSLRTPWTALVLAACGVVATIVPSPIHGQTAPPALEADPAIACTWCEGWNGPREPFRVFGNTYFVGVQGLSAVAIATTQGLIVLDGGLPQSAPRVAENLERLGFSLADVRLLGSSHPHFDHAGGLAALQRASGAAVLASEAATRVLRRGEPFGDDPQFGFGSDSNRFPPVSKVRTVADGETVRLGDVHLTAHHTPGHTAGGVTWTWRSCEGDRCLDVVYADSLNAVSAPGYRFADHPQVTAALERSIERISNLPCDILIAVHPGFAGLDEKLSRRAADPASEPFVDPKACRAYAQVAGTRLTKRLEEERAALPD